MKALPSIAFNEFKGSAGDVTARVSKGRQVLSARSMHSSSKTPAQAVSRNRLAKISRSYKKLTNEQMKAWAVLAEKMKGISTFGQAAELTPHNAFVRINSNRAMVGMPLLTEAPVYKADVPEVEYEDFWITPERIVFMNVQQPSDNHFLVVKMSPAQSPGVTNGWSKTVIVAPGVDVEYGDVELTERYVDIKGFELEAGKKYFCEFWWLDSTTGFTGESMWVSAICKETSVGYDAPYVPRAIVEIDEMYLESTRNYISDTAIGFSKGSTMVNAKFHYEFRNTRVNAYYELDNVPDSVPNCRIFVLGRGTKLSPRSVNMIRVDFTPKEEYFEVQVCPEIYRAEHYYDVFDTTIAIKK